ncbi:hypothetical protein ABK040_005416 [Willaertia magna]
MSKTNKGNNPFDNLHSSTQQQVNNKNHTTTDDNNNNATNNFNLHSNEMFNNGSLSNNQQEQQILSGNNSSILTQSYVEQCFLNLKSPQLSMLDKMDEKVFFDQVNNIKEQVEVAINELNEEELLNGKHVNELQWRRWKRKKDNDRLISISLPRNEQIQQQSTTTTISEEMSDEEEDDEEKEEEEDNDYEHETVCECEACREDDNNTSSQQQESLLSPQNNNSQQQPSNNDFVLVESTELLEQIKNLPSSNDMTELDDIDSLFPDGDVYFQQSTLVSVYKPNEKQWEDIKQRNKLNLIITKDYTLNIKVVKYNNHTRKIMKRKKKIKTKRVIHRLNVDLLQGFEKFRELVKQNNCPSNNN